MNGGSGSITALKDSTGVLRVVIERQPGFVDPIELSLTNAPAGAGAPVVVAEGDDAALPLSFGPGVPTGPLDLVIEGRAGEAVASAPLHVEVKEAQPRSLEQIRAAFAAGQIDLGTSLLYRAYALFGDERLPASFVGSGPEEDLALVPDIEAARPTLSAATLEQLQPFLVRPDDPKSVFNAGQSGSQKPRAQRQPLASSDTCSGGTREWITARSTVAPVRAWALCQGTHGSDETAQNHLRRIISAVDKGWEKLSAIGMRPPNADEYADEAIDVYSVPPGTAVLRQWGNARDEGGQYTIQLVRGRAIPQPPWVGRTSSGYVMMPTWRIEESNYGLTLIHELFHILQFAHNYARTGYWFAEASATWASVHVNRLAAIQPGGNTSLHEERFGAFQKSKEGLLSLVGDHAYFAYIWPFFMEQQTSAGRIAEIWVRLEGVGSDPEATEVLDGAFSFKDNFRTFALRNANQKLEPGNPITPRYEALDPELKPEGILLPDGQYFTLTGGQPLTPPVNMPALSARYFGFILGEDAVVQSVEVDFSGLSGRGHLFVDALIKNDDGWHSTAVPLEDEPKTRFCFDLGPSNATVRGSFLELRLILSNYTHTEGEEVQGNLNVRPSRTGCGGWTGEIRYSNLQNVPGVLRSEMSTVATVSFVVDEDPPGGSAPGIVLYKVRSGHVTYHADVTIEGGCHEVVTGSVEMSPLATSGQGMTVASLATFATDGVLQYGSNSGATFGNLTVAGNCTPDGSQSIVERPNTLIPWWNHPGTYTLKEQGTVMQEDVSTQSDQSGARSTWLLRKVSN